MDEAVSEIYNYTRGYPRKITKLCHQILKELILQNKQAVDRVLVRDVIEKDIQYMTYPGIPYGEDPQAERRDPSRGHS